jgi:uncharacterized membrane protein YbhN (UPF0104 family)
MLDELAGTKYFSKFEFGMRSGYRMEQKTTYKLIVGNLVWSCFIWINKCTINILVSQNNILLHTWGNL